MIVQADRQPETTAVVGVDIAARALWAVRLDLGTGPATVAKTALLNPADTDAILHFCDGASVIAIDAPDGPSRGCHLDEARLAPKFRTARCAEVALRHEGLAVPWTTPMVDPDPWMVTGYGVWDLLRRRGLSVIETFPFAVFHRLNGGRPAKKGTLVGHHERLDLLRPLVTLPAYAEMWGHDGVDALAAACVAAGHVSGAALAATCANDAPGEHDGSAIWLLPPPAAGAVEPVTMSTP